MFYPGRKAVAFFVAGATALAWHFAARAGKPAEPQPGPQGKDLNPTPLTENFRMTAVAQNAANTNVDLWRDGSGRLTKNAAAVLGVLEASAAHGLNPDAYKVKEIKALMAQDAGKGAGEVDKLLRASLVQYARDMTGPRIDPSVVRSRPEYWRKPLSESEIMTRAGASDPGAMLRDLEPKTPHYAALKQELNRLMNLPPEPARQKIVLPGILMPGQGHKAVPQIRAHLGLPEKTGAARNTYDPELVAAVKVFQSSRGLNPDGIIGAATIDQMNFTNADRMRAVIVNLERLRWNEPRPDRYIEVNIADQTLIAVENGKVAHKIDMIVGRPARQTIEFKTTITGVRFNPQWNVPNGIMVNDKLPDLRKDPYSLEKKHIYVYRDGKRIDPGTVDWHGVTRDEMIKRYKLIQTPGPHNALGHVRVIMDNRYDEYLHYTNEPELFEKDMRALSSGCMRMKEPDVIAAFLLRAADVDKYKAGPNNNNVRVPQTVAFYSVYHSVTVAPDGKIAYHADVYGRDKAMADTLERRGLLPKAAVSAPSVANPQAPRSPAP